MSNGESTALARMIRPTSFAEAMEMATKIAQSDLVPAAYKGKPANILIAWEMGAEVGLSPMAALQSIAVINGKPSLYGEAPLAIVMASGHLEEISEENDGEIASCTLKRKGWPNKVTRTFSMEEARKAKVYEKDANGTGKWIPLADRWSYQSWGKDMIGYRARGRALKAVFADVLKGLDVAEAAIESPPNGAGSGTVIDVEPQPENSFMPKQKAAPDGDGSVNAMAEDPMTAEDRAMFSGMGDAPGAPGAGVASRPSPQPSEAPRVAQEAASAPAPAEVVSEVPPQAQDAPAATEAVQERPREQAEIDTGGVGSGSTQEPESGSAPPPAEVPADGKDETTFTIASQTFKTKGCTREQMLELFKLCPAVDRKKGRGFCKAMLAGPPFGGLATRSDLTKEAADKYIAALRGIVGA